MVIKNVYKNFWKKWGKIVKKNFWEKFVEYGLLCCDGLYYVKIIYYEQ